MTTKTSGLTPLRKTQIAAETTDERTEIDTAAITDLGADSGFHFLQHGNMTVTPTAEHFTPEEQRGVFATNHSVIHTSRMTELSWESPADFAQIVDFLRMGVRGDVTPVTVDGGDVFVWVFQPNNSSSNRHHSYTVEHGDNKMVARVPHVLMSEMGFSGGIAEVVNMSVSMFGREMVLLVDENTNGAVEGLDASTVANSRFRDVDVSGANTLFTGYSSNEPAPVLPHAEMMTMSKSKVYLDDQWADIGTTHISGVLRAWEFTLPTGLAMFKTAEGLLDFINYTEATRAASVKFTFVTEDTPIGEWYQWLQGNLRTIRITIDGEAINSDWRHQLILDMNCRWNENTEIFSDDEGRSMVIVTGTTFFDHKDNSGFGDNDFDTSNSNTGTDKIVPEGSATGNDFRITVVTRRGPIKAPVALRTSALAATSATLAWNEVTDETSYGPSSLGGTDDAFRTYDIDGYDVQWGTDNTFATKTDVDITSGTDLDTDLSSLTTKTTYYARVRAKDGDVYGGWSETLTFTTP